MSDLSNTNFDNISADGLIALGNYGEHIYSKSNIVVKTAAYCPTDLPYGMISMYKAWSEQSPEKVKIFRRLDAAKAWLMDECES